MSETNTQNIPAQPSSFFEQMQEKIAGIDTAQKLEEFKNVFDEQLSKVRDSLTAEQLAKMKESLEAKWESLKNGASDQAHASWEVIKKTIDWHQRYIDLLGNKISAAGQATVEVAKDTTAGAMTGIGSFGESLSAMWKNMLRSIRPVFAPLLSLPFLKFFVKQETIDGWKKALEINDDYEALKNEIAQRLPQSIKLAPDTSTPDADEKAFTLLTDTYKLMANKPAERGVFIKSVLDTMTMGNKNTVTLTEIAKAADEFRKEQPQIPSQPTTPASSTAAA